jgi:hypothetical protein
VTLRMPITAGRGQRSSAARRLISRWKVAA